jgi:hypothetical protein
MSDGGLVAIPMQSLSVQEVRAHAALIQDLMKSVMIENVHYGKIPGCGDKPALYKPGAEKICLIFGLVPSFDIQAKELEGGHREYETTCTLRHRQTGQVVGQGVGVCSTMESKYRYRWDNTGNPVPAEYWESRNPDLLGGPAFSPRKSWVDGKQVWMIFRKIEHPDPADNYNTAKKISKKRGHIDATITATAAGDCFTPIAEDDADTFGEGAEAEGAVASGSAAKPKSQPKRRSDSAATGKESCDTQWRGVIASCVIKRKGTSKEGKPYTIYTVTAKDGATFDTFSDTHASLCTPGAEVVIAYESGQYGRAMKSCEPVGGRQEEPGANG